DRCFKQIIGEIDRLTQLLSELVNFSRPERHNFKPNDLRETMQGVITLVEGIAKKQGITIKTDFAPHLPPVLYEPSLIKQAFLNLMTNAIEAMPSGGRVEISIALLPAAGCVRVTIKDTGSGIPPELLPKVMAPFFTTKEYGTGLGLAVTRQIIVEGHGGRLWLESRVKEGTTVYVELPIFFPRGGELAGLREADETEESASCPTA
ncbi:MAG: ATP-binding protein, partial [Bacillota bacterium]|nr:ATP-binding protein [Bacillota bacterium]